MNTMKMTFGLVLAGLLNTASTSLLAQDPVSYTHLTLPTICSV